MLEFRVTDAQFASCLRFAQELVQLPSLPGQEEAVARRVEAEMQRLGYDQVWIDGAGNVVGLVAGEERGGAVLLNAHMDHVSVSDSEPWPHPPFAGVVADGRLWGRGTADLKAALAVLVHAPALLRARGQRPRRDVLVSAVVMEEVGGLGTLYLLEDLPRRGFAVELAFVAEPTGNELRHGHRGRFELTVELNGRSCHASEPALGANPNAALGPLLQRLLAAPQPRHPLLGAATCTPTRIVTDQLSTNVVPGRVTVAIDYRAIPGQYEGELVAQAQAWADEAVAAAGVPGLWARVEARRLALRTWTGLERQVLAGTPAFLLPADDPRLQACRRLLEEAWGRSVPVKPWRFATDGGHLAAAGIPVVGFSPCEEQLVHTVHESVSLGLMREGLDGYVLLLAGLAHILG